jgi:hypothetical protein
MKVTLIVSILLMFTYFVTISQPEQSHNGKKHHFAVDEKGVIKVSIMYPFEEGKTFDMENYEIQSRSEKLYRSEFKRADNYMSMMNHGAIQGGENFCNRLDEIEPVLTAVRA